jgi:hypothetical protein
MKPNKYLLFLLAMVVGYGLFEYYRPKPIDWTSTYQNDDKIPFGTRALFELLPSALNNQPVTALRVPIYNHLTEDSLPKRSNYVFVNQAFELDKNDTRELLKYVRRGNNVLISAYDFPDSLPGLLGFKASLKAPELRDTLLLQNFVNPVLKKPVGYNFFHDDGRNFLALNKPIDRLTGAVTVLARNARKEPIFVQIRYGQGQFLVHNLPLAFTNFFVLSNKTSDHAAKALSYLPALPTYWDEYQKQGRFGEDEQSILRYVFSQPPLMWAYYLLVWGLILYMIFAGKRTQRIIPVVEPPRNTSLEFVETVGQLYFQQQSHDNVARKKIQYFLANIRERYGLNTNELNAEFTETLAQKSGADATQVADLVRLLRNAQRSISLSENDLLVINFNIEKFLNTEMYFNIEAQRFHRGHRDLKK